MSIEAYKFTETICKTRLVDWKSKKVGNDTAVAQKKKELREEMRVESTTKIQTSQEKIDVIKLHINQVTGIIDKKLETQLMKRLEFLTESIEKLMKIVPH